eukprot:Anaeramoba_ignava/c18348_g1_i1.p1 GENE.c18348_g1_i1~~c18348_g1_i1.p1  ORF type:complete len:367 (+),score=135.84 c18348_g1_i1:36-1103(+)
MAKDKKNQFNVLLPEKTKTIYGLYKLLQIKQSNQFIENVELISLIDEPKWNTFFREQIVLSMIRKGSNHFKQTLNQFFPKNSNQYQFQFQIEKESYQFLDSIYNTIFMIEKDLNNQEYKLKLVQLLNQRNYTKLLEEFHEYIEKKLKSYDSRRTEFEKENIFTANDLFKLSNLEEIKFQETISAIHPESLSLLIKNNPPIIDPDYITKRQRTRKYKSKTTEKEILNEISNEISNEIQIENPNEIQIENPNEIQIEKINQPIITEDNQNKNSKGKRVFWTDEETRFLIFGVKKYGVGRWSVILSDSSLQFHMKRKPHDLKDKWRNLKKKFRRRDLLEKYQYSEWLESRKQETSEIM